MRTIYRIQHREDGRGPYRSGLTCKWCDPNGRILPTFEQEFPDLVYRMWLRFNALGGHFGCGFASLDQLHAWFTGNEIKKLHGLGYQIVKIDTHLIMNESKHQLVFWHEKPLRDIGRPVIL